MVNLNAPIQIQPVIIPFAIAPALVGADHPIDYSTQAGQSLYISATKELPYIFGEDNSILALLQAVRYRSNESGWSDILYISVGFSAPNVPIFRNLLMHYGKITLAHVRANATADYIGQQNQNFQSSNQIYRCLRNSVTQDFSDRLVTEDDAFHIEGQPNGPYFLMTLIDV